MELLLSVMLSIQDVDNLPDKDTCFRMSVITMKEKERLEKLIALSPSREHLLRQSLAQSTKEGKFWDVAYKIQCYNERRKLYNAASLPIKVCSECILDRLQEIRIQSAMKTILHIAGLPFTLFRSKYGFARNH